MSRTHILKDMITLLKKVSHKESGIPVDNTDNLKMKCSGLHEPGLILGIRIGKAVKYMTWGWPDI